MPPGAYPWMVALSRGCGATLIAPDRVLTAAHCVEDMRTDDLRVYVGARSASEGPLRYDGVPVRPSTSRRTRGYRASTGGGPRATPR